MKIIWVDSVNGSDVGDGTRGTPYRTIDRAKIDHVSGDQIRLLEGTYAPSGSVVFDSVEGSLFSEVPLGAVVQPTYVTDNSACIVVRNSPRFYVQGIKVQQSDDDSKIGILVDNTSKCLIYTCEVSNFAVLGGESYGVFVSGSSYITSLGRIEKCDVYNMASAGTKLSGIRTDGVIYDIVDNALQNISGGTTCDVSGIEYTFNYLPFDITTMLMVP
jgi:hypothetical protein